jgi:large subunit ribosomal protein L21
MYAIIELGGRQWKVVPGTRLDVNRLTTDVGAAHTVDRVLLAQTGAGVEIGKPYVTGARVVCEVVAHRLSEKTISYHFRRRENFRKTVGHRQPLTRLMVKEIHVGSEVIGAEHAASTRARAGETKPKSPRVKAARGPAAVKAAASKKRSPSK